MILVLSFIEGILGKKGMQSFSLKMNSFYNLFIIICYDAQIDVDIGSSSVARSVIGIVLGYVTSLVVDLAILIEVFTHFLTSLSTK